MPRPDMDYSSMNLPPSAHVEKRPTPNLLHDRQIGMKIMRKLYLTTNPNRTRGSMPPQKDLNKLSKSGQRLAKAMVLMERVTLQCSTFIHRGYNSSPYGVSITTLTNDDTYMQCCVDIIQSMVLSNFRAPLNPKIFNLIPHPTCLGSCTTLPPLENNHCHLMNVGTKHWVIMLANALLGLFFQLKADQSSLKVVHELHSHLDSTDWSELQRSDITKPLDENYCRHALALLGAKKAKQIFKISTKERKVSPLDEELSSSFLLDEIETFAREQIHAKPESATGYSYMGWVAAQSPSVRSINALAAAADGYYWYKRAYEVADADGDDFISCSARLDAAHNMIRGGTGMVTLGSFYGDANVRRDFRSDFSSKAKELGSDTNDEFTIGNNVGFKLHIDSPPAFTRKVFEYERNRRLRQVPGIDLGPGECCLIEWWEVLTLWNKAMKYYDKMEKFHMGCHIYGEGPISWNTIVERLHYWTEVARLTKNQYSQYSEMPGSWKRERALEICAHCKEEKKKMKKCARCQVVYYCSRECQKRDWKNHKKCCVRATNTS